MPHLKNPNPASFSAEVIAVCKGEQKGISKTPVETIELVKGGVVDDAHFGGEKEVSLLAYESILAVKERFGLDVGPGTFAENITVIGLKKEGLKVGTRLKVASAVLEIVAIGKESCKVCSIAQKVGVCIGDTETVFCKVIEPGVVKAGDKIFIL
ncbi:MAG: MOSC domain-containing protein [Planctomycetota bacterium]|nr:MOSC domain-containing protein [Planctomycetota bacterium]